MGYDVIGPNEPPLTGIRSCCADSDHRTAEQETQRDTAVCTEPGSHIILSTPRERPGGTEAEAVVQLLKVIGEIGRPGTARLPPHEQ